MQAERLMEDGPLLKHLVTNAKSFVSESNALEVERRTYQQIVGNLLCDFDVSGLL